MAPITDESTSADESDKICTRFDDGLVGDSFPNSMSLQLTLDVNWLILPMGANADASDERYILTTNSSPIIMVRENKHSTNLEGPKLRTLAVPASRQLRY